MDKIIIAFKKGYRCTADGKLLNPKGKEIGYKHHRDEYLETKIRIDGKNVNIEAHRLQAFQKYGHKLFEKGIEVRHLNAERHDFSWENICIGTHSQNMMDVPEQIRIASALCATAKVRKYDKQLVRKFHAESNSYKKTMENFGISSKGTLHFILNK